MTIILIAIPFFFLLIAIELIAEWYRKTDYYRVNDSITSLALGVVSRATYMAKKLIPFTIYLVLVEHIAIVNLPNELWVWVLAFVLYDFCYYWLHRFSHEINLLWAAHVVHHSSEEYNLTTALRQTSGGIIGWMFYLPMALLGIPAEIYISVGAMSLVYQFWVHTRHVPKLGWFEEFFVSPSNHRVHHAQNQVYIDRNYGGVFILWDRWFGTFQEELDDEPCIFGIRKPLKSWNPIWANLHVYWQLGKDAWNTKSWKDKVAIWFKPTGWRPDDVQISDPLPPADLSKFKKWDISISFWQKGYSLLQHALIVGATLVVMLNISNYNDLQAIAGVTYIIFACVSLGMLMSNNKWSYLTEMVKHGALIGLMGFLAAPQLTLHVAIVVAVVSILMLVVLFKQNKAGHLVTE